jgi:hypothetical protein
MDSIGERTLILSLISARSWSFAVLLSDTDRVAQNMARENRR